MERKPKDDIDYIDASNSRRTKLEIEQPKKYLPHKL